MNKKIIIISTIIILIFIGIFVYIRLNKTNYNNLKIEKVINQRVFYPCFSQDNILFLSDKGIILYKYDFKKQELNKIMEEEILGALNMICNNDLTNVIVYSNYPENQFINYDLSKKNNQKLNINISQIVYDNKSDNIYYVYNDGIKNIYNLNLSKPDGSNWKKLVDLPETSVDFNLRFVNDKLFLLLLNDIYLYDQNSNKINKLLQIKADSPIIISNSANLIAYNEYEKNTVIYNINTNKKTDLQSRIDLYKSAFSNDEKTIYTINNINTLSIYDINNNLYKEYNIDDSQLINTNLIDENISNINISDDDSIIYFTHNYFLYFIKLK